MTSRFRFPVLSNSVLCDVIIQHTGSRMARVVLVLLALVWQNVIAGRGPTTITLSPTDIRKIVSIHNKLRRSLSSSNMRYMTWDDELARGATEYGTKCQFSHNRAGFHSKFRNSIGENIYVSRSPLSRFDPVAATQMWFDEKSDFDYATLTCEANKKCGHYTQVAWAASYKIGCSLTMCDYVSDFEHEDSHLFICNYSPAGNVYSSVDGKPKMMTPFLVGGACSKCEDTTDTCNNKLCANALRDTTHLNLPPQNPPTLGPLEPLAPLSPDKVECDVMQTSSGKSLVAAVVILSLFLVALLFYTLRRERSRLNTRLTVMNPKASTAHTRFSNQNTPVPSRPTSPKRHSIISNNSLNVNKLHGNSNLRKSSSPAIIVQRMEGRRFLPPNTYSAPTTPCRPKPPVPPKFINRV
uniref:GLIPR1-like protein 1 n=1 Tax=Ciona intestinalis TaxID=7719 RepID=F6UUD7_CIOIN|nr:GLIPR1-like protein 1 [Ciona intestinalis]|eukprot:XP_002128732.1 GLIPR1-like protein 1 [Ciona intestinalis]